MQSISTIGLDIAKSVFQVHGVDAAGQLVLRRQLKRRRSSVFHEAHAVPCWHRSLRFIALLGARASSGWTRRAPDTASLREALCQATEE